MYLIFFPTDERRRGSLFSFPLCEYHNALMALSTHQGLINKGTLGHENNICLSGSAISNSVQAEPVILKRQRKKLKAVTIYLHSDGPL